jgi:hypothetical protein
MKHPNNSKAAFLGTACNVGHTLTKVVQILRSSFKDFREIRFFIVESNSSDDTKDVLEKLSTERDFIFQSIPNDQNAVKFRTESIANARNKALSVLRESDFNPDYVVVVDLDEINLGLSSASVLSNWEYENWAGMFANQPDGYYDIWALEHPFWNPRNYIADFEHLKKEFNENISKFLSVTSKKIKIPKTNPIVEVNSAFGGIGIYDYDFFSDVYYSGIDEQGYPIADHVSVNRSIRNKGGKLFINPKFTNTLALTNLSRLKSILYEKYFR